MITTNDLYNAMSESSVSGTRFQSVIREFWSNMVSVGASPAQAASEVAVVMGEWRSVQEEEAIQTLSDKSERDAKRKVVNNVIGDVSRNVRSLSDNTLTIKCAKKKPYYVYEVVEVQKPNEPEVEESEEVEEVVPVHVTTSCAEDVQALVDKHGLQEVAQAVADLIKAQADSK
jgi:phosphopantetheine adenylyltransferase